MSIPRFQKVFALGHRTVKDIFMDEVEITEKIDGSQFGFAKISGELFCRSRGMLLEMEAPEKMFKPAVDYVKSIQDKLPESVAFYGEYLKQPKHNTLAYDNAPKNHIALFGAVNLITETWYRYTSLKAFSEDLDIDVVPLVYTGKIEDPGEILTLLERTSYLGGQNIEGVVVKNYSRDNLIGDTYLPMLAGKYVTEKFKERHGQNKNFGKGKLQDYIDSFNSEARWDKAIIHMKEAGELVKEPKDIGGLVQLVHKDLLEEDIDDIKDFLWKLHRKAFTNAATRGLPEWYKGKLLKGEI